MSNPANNRPVTKVDEFLGLNDKEDRTRLSPAWLEIADNVDLDDTGAVRRRNGYTLQQGGIVDCFNSKDRARAWLVTSSHQLLKWDGVATEILVDDIGEPPYCWTEAGNVVFIKGAEADWAIYPDGAIPWGVPVPPKPVISLGPGTLPAGEYLVTVGYRGVAATVGGGFAPQRITLPSQGGITLENIAYPSGPYNYVAGVYMTKPDGRDLYLALTTDATTVTLSGNPDNLAYKFDNLWHRPPPPGDIIEFHRGRVWVGMPDDSLEFTRLFPSHTLQYHGYEHKGLKAVDVPGRVIMLASTPSGMIVGTERQIFALVENLDVVAEYGATRGSVSYMPDGNVLFLSQQGICKALPFENLTREKVTIPTSLQAAGIYYEHNGFNQYIAVPSDNGIAHNPYGTRVTPVLQNNLE